MKINSKFKVRNIAGESIIVQQGRCGANLSKVISLNETAVFLYDKLSGKDFTEEEAADLLVDNYEVNRETALKDAAAWVKTLRENNIIDE